ncbi:MAG: hypothetical protein IID46_08755 [Planctomycetes bacterium]|nr:hypothetical protein [Planctomycetota bacterium]
MFAIHSEKRNYLNSSTKSTNGRLSRICLIVTLLAAYSHVSTGVLSAQGKGSSSADEEKRTIRSLDGWPIAFTYYKPKSAGENTPPVILLHKKNGNRLVWNKFAKRLQVQGYAVFAVDLRKHGESKLPAVGSNKKKKKRSSRSIDLKKQDYERMVTRDLEGLKKFIVEEHQAKKLNVRKMAIIAAQESAPIAINFAARDWTKRPHDDSARLQDKTPRGQDVRALVLLSPNDKVPGISTGKSIGYLKSLRIAVFIAYGAQDTLDNKQSEKMFKKFSGAKGNNERMELHKYSRVKYRGTDMLRLGGRIKLQEQMLDFLNKHVKSLPDKWRDRRSRLRT